MTLKLTLSCKDLRDCLDLANFILNYKGVNASLIKYEVRKGCLEIAVFGTNVEKASVKAAILKAYKEWKSITSWKRGSNVIEVQHLIKLVGKPFITEALVEALNLTGIKAKLKNGYLISEGKWNEILALATKLAHALEELVHVYPKASYSAKALITSFATLTNTEIKQVVNYLRDIKVIEIHGHRVVVKKEWRHLLRELLQRKVGVDIEDRS